MKATCFQPLYLSFKLKSSIYLFSTNKCTKKLNPLNVSYGPTEQGARVEIEKDRSVFKIQFLILQSISTCYSTLNKIIHNCIKNRSLYYIIKQLKLEESHHNKPFIISFKTLKSSKN